MKVNQKGSSTTPVLITILLFVMYIVWGENIYQAIMEASDTIVISPDQPIINKDDIVSVELIDINYWEARFNVNYKHRTGRKSGYLTVTGEKWTPNAGLNTSSGAGGGVTYLSRKYAQENSYFDTYIEAKMYDPYRADHNFSKKQFPTDLIWPDKSELPKVPPELDSRHIRLGGVVIYRNVPNYIEFAERLVKNGFPAHKMTMMLSVCSGCPGGLIYGDNVNFDELQSVLTQLKEHGFSLPLVYHSPESKHAGKIYIGNTPPKGSKPLWSNINTLLSKNIEGKEFFNVLDFPQKENWEIAIDKTEKAKSFINRSGKKNFNFARSLLDQAMKLDSSYIPAYLESARLIIRSEGVNEYHPSESGIQTLRKAKNVILSALKIDPIYADSYVLLGYTETLLKDYKSAGNSFNKAENLGTKNLWLIYNRALMFKGLKQEQLAVKEYQKAIEIGPDGGDNDRALKRILNKLAFAYREAGRVEESLSISRHLHTIFPNFYSGNVDYIKTAIANDTDKGNVEKIIDIYKRKNWKVAYHADAMISLMDAANKVSTDKAYAISSIASAQASSARFIAVIADLSKGKAGRNAVEQLFKYELLEMNRLEESSSLLLELMESKDLKPLEFSLKMGANPNFISTGYYSSPLIKAIMKSDKPLVELLLNFGADPFLKAANNYSAFDWAERYAKPEFIKMLNRKRPI